MNIALNPAAILSSANAAYIAELFAQYTQAPASVDAEWAEFFKALGDDGRSVLAELQGASWSAGRAPKIIGVADVSAANSAVTKSDKNKAAVSGKDGAAVTDVSAAGVSVPLASIRAAALDSIRALMLIRAYRVRGHLLADLDPLKLQPAAYHPELDYKTYGFTESDLERKIFIDNVLGMQEASLREILAALQGTYCGRIGTEFMHVQDPAQKAWIQQRIEENWNQTEFTIDGKKKIYERLVAAEGFERFLDKKFTGTKRFGLEGGEALIPAIEQILKRGGQLGLKEMVLGMAHRGRLNVLTNVMSKSFTAMFAEFQGLAAVPDSVEGSGDVKYHLGASADREFDGQRVHLSLTANPSHLEAVNPVVVGKVRAKQQQHAQGQKLDAEAFSTVVGLLLHGDAAFAGQGIVAETLMMSDLKGYRTGGVLHIVINNQIGFTTTPSYGRSGVYCTEIAKMIDAPVLHVNGDDVEAVVHCARVAIEFRQQFHRDVVIDLVCYRRHGHNESDEPAFTQPLMYKAIRDHRTTCDLYAEQLANEGVLSLEESQKIYAAFQAMLEEAFQAASSYKANKADWLEGRWQGFEKGKGENRRGHTGVEMDVLKEVGLALARVPSDFKANSKILRQLDAKREMIERGVGIDWATAEAMAFGTLCVEGHPVRLSGQDVGRGTFSQRHAILYDQENENRYLPINNIRPNQAVFSAFDSPLSEFGVLGFDYGFSLAEPQALVCWEGQFGDFVNGAQVMIDQFIASAESKWLRMSGLVMLLPHGYEGQGPEHSSARPERFLQLCAEDNLQVVNATTPANYFHVLRRQIHRNFRKPLIMMTPKSLLRHKRVVSTLAEFSAASSFHRVLPEMEKDIVSDSKVRRVVLCTGKVYYDLLATREERNIKDVVLLRLEQLYPFPQDALLKELKRYSKADLVWCQEEPENQGYWFFVDRRIEAVMREAAMKIQRPAYVGRAAAAAPATGSLKRHNLEQAALIDAALTPGKVSSAAA